MLFSFFLGTLPPERVKRLRDLVSALRCGLTEAGHPVTTYGLGLVPAPGINLLIEGFADDGAADMLLKLKADHGEKMHLGIVCADDLADDDAMQVATMPRRAANLRRLLPVADFAWTLLPQELPGAGKAARLELGFSAGLVCRNPIAEPGLRDLDVLILGEMTSHRQAILERLRERGLTCYAPAATPLPGFVLGDLVRRAKLLVDLRRHASARFASPVTICLGLHHGTLVVSEGRDTGLGRAGTYVAAVDPGDVVEQCVQIVRSGLAVQTGLAALAKFRGETSLRRDMAAALETSLPGA
jgi:hypothetical protein